MSSPFCGLWRNRFDGSSRRAMMKQEIQLEVPKILMTEIGCRRTECMGGLHCVIRYERGMII